jgi:hypothetical protein
VNRGIEGSRCAPKALSREFSTSPGTTVAISSFVIHWSFVLRHLLQSLPFQYLILDFFMPERIQKPVEPTPWGPKQGEGGGPRSPDVSRPDTKDLLKKMRRVDPNQSKRYRQRTGQ